jgi:hypothetical protein
VGQRGRHEDHILWTQTVDFEQLADLVEEAAVGVDHALWDT